MQPAKENSLTTMRANASHQSNHEPIYILYRQYQYPRSSSNVNFTLLQSESSKTHSDRTERNAVGRRSASGLSNGSRGRSRAAHGRVAGSRGRRSRTGGLSGSRGGDAGGDADIDAGGAAEALDGGFELCRWSVSIKRYLCGCGWNAIEPRNAESCYATLDNALYATCD